MLANFLPRCHKNQGKSFIPLTAFAPTTRSRSTKHRTPGSRTTRRYIPKTARTLPSQAENSAPAPANRMPKLPMHTLPRAASWRAKTPWSAGKAFFYVFASFSASFPSDFYFTTPPPSCKGTVFSIWKEDSKIHFAGVLLSTPAKQDHRTKLRIDITSQMTAQTAAAGEATALQSCLGRRRSGRGAV